MCIIHIQDEKIVRKMLATLRNIYKKSDTELITEIDCDFNRLRKPPRKQDIVTWMGQWNVLYLRALKLNHTKCTDYTAVMEFLKAAKPIHPEFALNARNLVVNALMDNKNIMTIPQLTKMLRFELNT
jgi:hypothetical protein